MLEIARYEVERRLLGTAVITAGFALFVGLVLTIAPNLINDVNIDALLEAYPPAMREAFGIETFGTLEGILATEIYQFGWLLLLGLYFAYGAGGLIAGDVERDRMDLLLSNPVSRTTVVVEKYLSLLGPMLVVNAAVALVVYVGAVAIDEPIPLGDVVAVHALSVPYLLACAGIGLLLSVLFDRADYAQRGAIGAVFGLFMVETLVSGTDYEFLGGLSPTRYYDPTAILVDGTYDLAGGAILLGIAAALVAASVLRFRRADV